MTRGVPCLRRATSLAYTDADEDAERLVVGGLDAPGADGDEWVETHVNRAATLDSAATPGDIEDIPDLDGHGDSEGVSSAMHGLSVNASLEQHGEIPDMDEIPDMEEEGLEEDDIAAAPVKPATGVINISLSDFNLDRRVRRCSPT